MRSFIGRYPVAIFISLTLLCQFFVVAVVYFMIPPGSHMHDVPAAHGVFRFRVFAPLVLAIGLTFYLEGWAGIKKLFGSFLHWKVPAHWYMLAFSWKFILGYLGIMAVTTMAIAPFPGWIMPSFFSSLLNTIIFIVGIAIVEETSWIRFSLTRLQEKYNSLTCALIVGLCWGMWYLPMMLLGEGVPDGIPWFAFLMSMFSLTTLLAWVYNSTRSGLVLLVMQIVSNCAFVFIPMLPLSTGNDIYIRGFVVFFLVVALLLVIFMGRTNLSRYERVRWSDPIDAEPTLAERGERN